MKKETVQNLTEILQGIEFSIQKFNCILNKVVITDTYKISAIEFKYNKECNKSVATLIYFKNDYTYEIRLFKFLANFGNVYTSKHKALKELKKQYDSDRSKIDAWAKNYLNVDPTKSEETPIELSEFNWLKKHTIKISAVLPNKANYIKIFNKVFPNAELVKVDTRDPRFDKDAQRSWVFSLLLDSTKNIPASLQNMKTRDGMPALKGNKFTQTAYIWKLVRDNPEDFKFGQIKEA